MKSVDQELRYLRVIAAFGRIPGVVGIGSGYKDTMGRSSDTLALKIFVRQKRPFRDIPPNQRIPAFFEGIPLDVCEETPSFPVADGPLVGGAKLRSDSGFGGTLGCFATQGSKLVMLTAGHTLFFDPQAFSSNADVGSPDIVGTGSTCCGRRVGVVGQTIAGQIDSTVDCGIASVNSTRPAQQLISGLGGTIPDGQNPDRILGVAPLKSDTTSGLQCAVIPGDHVRKVGATTHLTGGKVNTLKLALPQFQDLPAIVPPTTAGATATAIVIVPNIAECSAGANGLHDFADEGDSGAIVMTDGNLVAAMLVRKVEFSDAQKAQLPAGTGFGGGATDIHLVLAALNIQIFASTGKQPTGTARALVGGTRIVRVPDPTPEELRWRQTFDLIKAKLSTFALGRRLIAFVEDHRPEITRLVNHCRRVTIVWHRLHGPAWVARVARDFRDLEQPIPAPENGAAIVDGVRSMMHALKANGSPELGAAMDSLWDPVRAAVARGETWDSLVHNLQSVPFDE